MQVGSDGNFANNASDMGKAMAMKHYADGTKSKGDVATSATGEVTDTQQGGKVAGEANPLGEINKSATSVAISMNALIVLYAMDNTQAQGDLFDFLAGKEIEGGYSLSDIGYDGKPITELSEEEASELLADGGFFSIDQTSDRVANFVFGLAGDDLEALKESREGIVQGFEEAKELFGGQLPEISYKTQNRTLELIDARIAELEKGSSDE